MAMTRMLLVPMILLPFIAQAQSLTGREAMRCIKDAFGNLTCTDGTRVIKDSFGNYTIIPPRTEQPPQRKK
jgi:hypothetical protein